MEYMENQMDDLITGANLQQEEINSFKLTSSKNFGKSLKDKTEIMNTYAIEQGYESWKELMSDEEAYVFETMIHVDNVTDLIQEELKNKIVKEVIENQITDLSLKLGLSDCYI